VSEYASRSVGVSLGLSGRGLCPFPEFLLIFDLKRRELAHRGFYFFAVD